MPLWTQGATEAPESPPVVELPSAEQAALQQFSRIRDWPAERVAAELAALEEAFVLQPLERHRLRLAVTLGFGACPKCEPRRAVALFKQVQTEAEHEATRGLAEVFVELLELQAQADARDRELAQALQQVEALQQKLDALTSIEESLHEREQPD